MKITHINFTKEIETDTVALIRELSNRGYIQQIITLDESKMIERLNNIKNIDIITTNKFHIFNLNCLRSSDIVHSHQKESFLLSYLAHLLYKIPYVITTSSVLNSKLLYKKANYTITTSDKIKYNILNYNDNINIETIYGGYSNCLIDKTNSQKIQNRFKYKFLIGNIASLDDEKGQFYLIEAMKKLQISYPTIHLLIIGEGKNELKYKIQASKLDNITFESDCEKDYIENLNIFILSADEEQNGSILFDAIESNVAIIATNRGVVPEIIEDKKSGLLIAPRNSNQIYSAIEKLYLDKNLRDKLTSNAYQNIQNYSPQEMTNRYERVYNYR